MWQWLKHSCRLWFRILVIVLAFLIHGLRRVIVMGALFNLLSRNTD